VREYGISISDTTGEKIKVYFTLMTYIDWKSCYPLDIRYTLPSTRYLIQKYVSRAYKTVDDIDIDITYNDILALPPTPINTIVDAVIDKAQFGSVDSIKEQIEEAEKQGMTLVGLYDRFILIHGGLEMYLTMLDQNALVRSNIISALEAMSEVSVYKRFNDAITQDIPVDIITSKDKYDNMMRRRNKGQHVPDPKLSTRHTPGMDNEDKPANMDELVKMSREALSEQLQTDKNSRNNRKAAFDWMRDEHDYTSHTKHEEKDIMGTKLHE
jgi:hypothetical protein